MNRFNSCFDRFINSLASIAGGFIVCMILLECYEIIVRYFLKAPTTWSVEVIEYMLFLTGFLGAAWLLKEGGHITVNLLVERLTSRTQTYLMVLASIIGAIISLIIIWYGLIASWDCYVSEIKIAKTYAMPKYIVLIFIPFVYALLSIEFMRELFGHLRKLKFKGKKGQSS